MKNSFDGLAAEIRIFMETNNLVQYPQALEWGAGSGMRVEWTDENWREFLLLAPVVGSSVVYIDETEFSVDDLSEEESEFAFHDSPFLDGDTVALISLIAREHDGETCAIRLAYVAGGVVHSWVAFAPWYEDALARIAETRQHHESRADDVVREIRELEDRSIQEDWATQVARDRRFYSAQALPSVRQKIALEIVTEISGLPSSHDGLERVSWSIAAAARHLLPQVKRDLEEDAIERLSELAAKLVNEHPEWATLRVGVREKYAKAFVIEEIGLNLPLVAEEIARFKV